MLGQLKDHDEVLLEDNQEQADHDNLTKYERIFEEQLDDGRRQIIPFGRYAVDDLDNGDAAEQKTAEDVESDEQEYSQYLVSFDDGELADDDGKQAEVEEADDGGHEEDQDHADGVGVGVGSDAPHTCIVML